MNGSGDTSQICNITNRSKTTNGYALHLAYDLLINTFNKLMKLTRSNIFNSAENTIKLIKEKKIIFVKVI